MNRSTCILCNRKLKSISIDLQQHPVAEDCLVKFSDRFGIPVDEDQIVEPEEPINRHEECDLKIFPFVETVLKEIFESRKLRRLGGVSTGRGWSSFSTFQRCWYAWKLRYLTKIEPFLPVEPFHRAVGSVIHTFAAVYYRRMIEPNYPLTPDIVKNELLKKANPEIVNESWRVFYAYACYYQHETIQPLSVEHDLVDPRTGESCRYDLIAFFPENSGDRLAGTYIIEHKSSSRFDMDTLDGWANDGEVLGQVMLWKRLGLDYRFGKLKGVIVNILGKQKEPRFHRTTVAPESWQIDQHREDLKRCEGLINLAAALNTYPRSRAGCITRYGRCDHYDHCAGGKS
jgi:hypothetical protein